MKKFIIVCMFIAPFVAEAQLKSILNRAKDKIKQKLENKADKEIDKTLEPSSGKEKEQEEEGNTSESKQQSTAPRSPIAAYSKYDFIPGEKVLFADDFAKDNEGELPLGWNTKGKGELVTLENQSGKWLRLFPGSTYLTGNSKAFGENYTIEFDLIVDGSTPKGTRFFPSFQFGMFSSGNKKVTDRTLFVESEWVGRNRLDISAKPNVDAISKMELSSRASGGASFDSESQTFAAFSGTFYKPAHYAIQVQKTRIRFWVNGQKVFDMPDAVITTVNPLNNLFFSVADYVFYNESNFGLYVSNLKVATGLPDTRHKLLEEGKFSTTGILFDLNSATIKPESFSVLKEISAVLKENADLKIKIVGHTSSDGDDAANLELSKKRAAAIKEAMVKEFKTDESRIQTEGKGETQPVADNKTKEGQAQNRRVEFIKI